MNIAEEYLRDKASDVPGVGYGICYCDYFKVTLDDLKGVLINGIFTQDAYILIMWKIFKMYVMTSLNYYSKPRVSMVHLQDEGPNPEPFFKFFLDLNIKFDSLSLSNFSDPLTVPPIATSIELLNASLTNYVIPG